ncbi:flp pilus-assembly TadE/G-like family protein [Actinomyces sp. B33]|uniref:Rv3654c family TadE-like protein n=1 Tax=Actinomyces sp. B33 TaxID=2942131 RepID=UPI00233FBBB9|nr:Rv3654c family TadE-like protein [Actinomyces sp. B33]MDC4232353.1 flp pilus-assembly TadE/G-like family protein [Actinomyces sp. B33]
MRARVRAEEWTRAEGEEGSGTILVLGAVLVASPLIAVLLVVGGIGTEQARLQAVVDLAALAGADVSAVAQWEDVGDRPCAAARSVVEANGEVMSECWTEGVDTLVVVSGRAGAAGIVIPIEARARAGVDP